MRRNQPISSIPAYYHVYNRGAGRRKIFENAADKAKFISIIARYLDDNEYVRGDGVLYEKSSVKLIAYCLMGNHFHLLLFQDQNSTDIQQFVKSVTSAYARYYNLHHNRSGYLFEGSFKAKRIDDDTYLEHITRYIHLNPRTYLTYKWSSLPEYLKHRNTEWVRDDLVNDRSPEKYKSFLLDYVDRAAELKRIKDELGID